MGAKKYFVFDDELWKTGFFEGCKAENGRVYALPQNVEDSANTSKAYYFSGSIDSGEKETVWHKLMLDFEKGLGGAVYLSYFATDENYIIYEDQTVLIEELIKSEALSVLEKLTVLNTAWVERVVNPDNVLLSRAKGRYLWFFLEIVMFSKKKITLNGLRIEFPYHNVSDMLPAVYRKNQETYSFFNRFLSVYQSFFEEMLDNVNNITRFFDSDAVDKEFLNWLAGWLGIENNGIWSEERLRRLIKSIYGMYRKKGTMEGLSEIIEFYTGEPPLIIENFKILSYYDGKEYGEAYKTLYGDSVYAFYVFISEEKIKNTDDLENIKSLAEAFCPAYTEPFIVPLGGRSGIGQHTYLGINSEIVKASGPAIDELLYLDNNLKL